MALYTFNDISLEVCPNDMEARARLAPLCLHLSFVPTNGVVGRSDRLSIRLHDESMKAPPQARPLFQAGGFSALEDGDSFYLTDNSSLFHLQAASGRGDAYLASSFYTQPELVQCNFWSFGLLKLLRPLKFYSLHAAGLVTPSGEGVLIIGPSGSGKSTLALGLIRRGWRYLSDDALLLHPVSGSISSIALREHFYVDASAALANSDLPLGGVVADNAGGQRRRVELENTVFSRQHTRECIPKLLLFSRIVPQDRSTLAPLDHPAALKRLLNASAPQLFDHPTMGQHLEALKSLLKQATSFELRAGLDLYRDPAMLLRLLRECKRWEATWPAL